MTKGEKAQLFQKVVHDIGDAFPGIDSMLIIIRLSPFYLFISYSRASRSTWRPFGPERLSKGCQASISPNRLIVITLSST